MLIRLAVRAACLLAGAALGHMAHPIAPDWTPHLLATLVALVVLCLLFKK
jgi:hypothetical protein